jgi:NAD-dependent deacetylase
MRRAMTAGLASFFTVTPPVTPDAASESAGSRFLDALRAGDVDGATSLLPADATLRVADVSQTWTGPEQIAAFLKRGIDDLHERAGSTRVHHLHGELRKARCTRCGTVHRWDGDLVERPPCSACGARGLRPHVVWFGEVPLGMDDVATALEAADLFVSIGTSGSVYPAAGFVQVARAGGAATLELNLVPSEGSAWFDEARHSPASELVPAWVDELTAQVEGR